MRVLMLGWELPPHNSGGLGVACYHMCKQLSQNGVRIQFLLPYTAEHNIDFMTVTPASPQDAVTVHQAGGAYDSQLFIHTNKDGSKATYSIYDQQQLFGRNVEQMVDYLEFDIIHAHDWLAFGAAVRAKRRTGKPLVVHMHATEHDRSAGGDGNPLVKEIEYEAMMMADRVVAVSGITRDVLVNKYRIPRSKIGVVHNSINLDDYSDPHPENTYTYLNAMKHHGYKVVSNIGRLTIQKGLTHLLEAARMVVDHQPKTLFLIVGSGEQLNELIEKSAELGISKNVLFAGFQRGRSWQDAFSISDLFVMPSVSEPFGLTPLESIRFGAPALVSKQSGVAEVIRNVLVTDYWDTQEMANQIVSVLRHQSLQSTLQENARTELAGLSWEKPAGELTRLYQNHMGAT